MNLAQLIHGTAERTGHPAVIVADVLDCLFASENAQFVIGRADGDMIGDYTTIITSRADDWEVAYDEVRDRDAHDGDTPEEFVISQYVLVDVARRTFQPGERPPPDQDSLLADVIELDTRR